MIATYLSSFHGIKSCLGSNSGFLGWSKETAICRVHWVFVVILHSLLLASRRMWLQVGRQNIAPTQEGEGEEAQRPVEARTIISGGSSQEEEPEKEEEEGEAMPVDPMNRSTSKTCSLCGHTTEGIPGIDESEASWCKQCYT